MASAGRTPGRDGEERSMTRTYATVLAVEVLVLLALWAAGRYFGSV
jgi:hypothetical protein